MIVYDSARQAVTLGQELFHGGEGVIYPVQLPNGPDLVAKLYTQLPAGYADKLAWMKANPPADPGLASGHASIAWPLDLLYNPPGQLAGYVMPYIRKAVPLLAVFNPRTRIKTLPDFNWRYLHRTARNLSAALSALHARGYIVGDLNESNVLTTPTALVTMIDTDSFQVHARGVMYYCPVGKPEYTPPELQGKSFRDLPRKAEHDSFGLAVLVFQLLMDGSHPFRAQWLGNNDPPSVEERIAQGWFPYAHGAGPVAPPLNLPPLNVLHPHVVALLERCFVDGHLKPKARPSPTEWESALSVAEHALIKCANGHYFSGHLRACPRCDAPNPRRRMPPAAARPAAQANLPATAQGPAPSQPSVTTPAAASSSTPVASAPAPAVPQRAAGPVASRRASATRPSTPIAHSTHPGSAIIGRLRQVQPLTAMVTAGYQRVRTRLDHIVIPLWVGWVLALVLGWTVGPFVAGLVRGGWGDLPANALFGAVVGLAQWLALRRQLPEAGWWGLITALAYTCGVTLDNWPGHTAGGLAIGPVALLLTGLAQAALLWAKMQRNLAWSWAITGGIGWAATLIVPLGLHINPTSPLLLPLAAAVDGAITGVLLVWLLHLAARAGSGLFGLRIRFILWRLGWRAVVAGVGLILLVIAAVTVLLRR